MVAARESALTAQGQPNPVHNYGGGILISEHFLQRVAFHDRRAVYSIDQWTSNFMLPDIRTKGSTLKSISARLTPAKHPLKEKRRNTRALQTLRAFLHAATDPSS